MNVEQVSEGMGMHPAHKGYLDAKRKEELKKQKDNVSDTSSSDQIEISDDAKKLMKRDSLLQLAKENFKNLPGVREENIREVVERVGKGYYDQEEVIEKIVELIFAGEGKPVILDTSYSVKSSDLTDESNVRWDKIREIEKRIEEGFYDKSEVLEVITTRLFGIF